MTVLAVEPAQGIAPIIVLSVMMVGLIGVIAALAYVFVEKWYAPICTVLVGLAVAFIIVLSVYPECTHDKYKVTIDDTVSLKEFNEVYTILEQEGDIYTIRYKD